jgi:hypothetical protein
MMNIQIIQITQSLSRTTEERLNSRKENYSAQNDPSLLRLSASEAYQAAVDGAPVLRDANTTAVYYPPFFPIGNTQDILSIKGVHLIKGEDVESKATAVTEAEQKAIRQQEKNNKTASTNAGPAQHEAAEDPEPKVRMPSVKSEENPGALLDFKI